jgi:hypothetical protein
MAVISYKRRKTLEKKKPSVFALPKEGKYPITDKPHAANAKARAKQMLNKDKLSKTDYDKVVKKADKMLDKGKPKSAKKSASKKRAVRKQSTKRR